MANYSALQRNYQIAQYSELLALAFDSGLSISSALNEIFAAARGETADSVRQSLRRLELGSNLYDELTELKDPRGFTARSELFMKLQIGLEFGTALSEQLNTLASSLRARVAEELMNLALRKENLMLLPLVFLILPVTVLFAIAPSIQSLQLSFSL